MSITSVGGAYGGFIYADLPNPGIFHYASAPLFASSTLASGSPNNKIAYIGAVVWADGGSHDIRKVLCRCGAVTAGSGDTLRCSLQDLDTVNGPAGRPDGTVDQSVTFASSALTANAVNAFTLTTDRTSVAHGTRLAVVFDITVAGSGMSVAFNAITINTDNGLGQAFPTTYNGTAWAPLTTSVPNIIFEAADGTRGCLSIPPVAAFNTHTFNSTSGTTRHALSLTPAAKIRVVGMQAVVQITSSNTFDFVLYDNGGSALATIGNTYLDSSPTTTNAWRMFRRYFSSAVEVNAGALVRAAVVATNAYNTAVLSADVPSAADLGLWPGGTEAQYTSYAGSWATPTATRVPAISLLCSGLETGGGGGGLIVNPGMNGGLVR